MTISGDKLLNMIIRRWWVVLLPVLIVSALTLPDMLNTPTASGGFVTSFKYTAAQELNLPQREGDYQDVWLASEYLVNAFTEWIRSSTFRQELQTNLGSDFDLASLGIATDNARSIGTVQMSYPTQEGMQAIVDESIVILSTRNQEYFPHLEGESARVQIVDEPTVSSSAPPLTNRFAPFIRIVLSGIVGLAFALAWGILDTRLRTRRDVEDLGMRVIGQIPR